MSVRKGFIPVLLILLLLTACGAGQTKAADSEQADGIQKSATPAAADANQGSTTPSGTEANLESTEAEGDVGDDTPLEWPSELMGPIPAPSGGVITSIEKGSSIFGEGAPDYITVVLLKGMDDSDCQTYVANLKELGFQYDVTEKDTETEFLYSGSLESGEAGVTFKFDFEYDNGYVSYNPQLNADSSETVSD